MLILTAVALAFASVLAFGGRLRELGRVQLAAPGLLAMALVAQVAAFTVFPDASTRVVATVHVTSYLLAGAFVLLNRSVSGVVPAGIGGGLNAVCIVANGGTLPASASALETAGIAHTPGEFANSGVLADPKLSFLGDVFAVPSWLPFANVFSIGDVVLVLGAAYGLHVLTFSRLAYAHLDIRPLPVRPEPADLPTERAPELADFLAAVADAEPEPPQLTLVAASPEPSTEPSDDGAEPSVMAPALTIVPAPRRSASTAASF